MNFPKLFLGVLVLLLALLLQVRLPVNGLHGDFILAALVAFAFTYGFWELFFFILLSVFAINWEPTLGADLLAFAAIPLAAYLIRTWSSWEPWIGVAVSTAAGILIFYWFTFGIPAADLNALLGDVIASVLFGELVAWGTATVS